MNANIGKLNNGLCYVFLNGDSEPEIYGTEEELEALIRQYGVVDPIPVFEGGVDLTDYPKAKYVPSAVNRNPMQARNPPEHSFKTMRTFSYKLISKDGYPQVGIIEAYNKTEARCIIARAYREDTPRNAKACGYIPWGDVKIVWED